MNLIDTNIILELLLGQEREEEVKKFLKTIPSSDIYITDFFFTSHRNILNKVEKERNFS